MSITLSSPLLLVYCAILAAVLGAVFGSFINCAAWRIAHGESFLKGRSHCAECGHELKALDLVPVFSYLFLRGKCRYCGKKISPRYMFTELLLAAAFVGIVLRFGISGETLRYLGLSVILLGLSLVDLETYRIPNGFIIAGIIWWAVTIPLVLPRDGASGLSAWIGPSLGVTVQSSLLGAFVIAGAMLLFSLLFDKITGKESLGGGDIKLLFVVGLYLGLAVGFFNLILSCITGLLMVALLKKQRIPFGPAIAAATYISLLAGPAVVGWYTGLF